MCTNQVLTNQQTESRAHGMLANMFLLKNCDISKKNRKEVVRGLANPVPFCIPKIDNPTEEKVNAMKPASLNIDQRTVSGVALRMRKNRILSNQRT